MIRACPQKERARPPRQTSQSQSHSSQSASANKSHSRQSNQQCIRCAASLRSRPSPPQGRSSTRRATRRAPARRDPIDTTPASAARAGRASIQKEEEDYSACTTVAAELAFARLEIAALQHDNAVLASENRVLANARNLPEVVADVREYIRHVVDGDDAVPCKPEV